jgi:hypothetical protein
MDELAPTQSDRTRDNQQAYQVRFVCAPVGREEGQ